MAKIITFPTVLNNTVGKGIWDEQKIHIATANSSGSTGSGSPATNGWQVEKSTSYFATDGNPFSNIEGSAWRIRFNTSIGNHYWGTAYTGFIPKQSLGGSSLAYSPIYDTLISGFSFNYKLYDAAADVGRTKHRFRCFKVGMVYRNSQVYSCNIQDATLVGSVNNSFMSFNHGGNSYGTLSFNVNNNYTHPMGMYVQLETEGGGTGSVSGSYMKIWNLKYTSPKSDQAIMILPKRNPDYLMTGDQAIWTI